MKSEMEIKQSLRNWVLEHTDKLSAKELTDDLPIIERRVITSMQTLDLILFIEQLSESTVDVESLKPGAFRNIDTIYKNFFQGNTNGDR